MRIVLILLLKACALGTKFEALETSALQVFVGLGDEVFDLHLGFHDVLLLHEGVLLEVLVQATVGNLVNQARQIKEQVAAEKAAQLSEQQINQIANGRLNKYFQENTLMEQEYIMESKVKVKDFIAKADKDLKCTGFKRLELGA